MQRNTVSIDIPVTTLYLPFNIAETPSSFSEQTGQWYTSDMYHFHTVHNVINNAHRLVKVHILGDPLCGSIEMEPQKHMRT
jgi:hypothetical protein